MDDRRHLARQPLPPALVEAETRRGELAGDGTHPSAVATRPMAEQIRHHGLHAPAGRLVALGADDDDDRPVGALEVARQQLHPDEPGGTGEQDRTIRARHATLPASDPNAHTMRLRVSAGAISSST